VAGEVGELLLLRRRRAPVLALILSRRISEDSALRKRLFTLLLESRYQLSAILSGEATTAGDPVRALFLDAWSELRAILADARYALFSMLAMR
jgi:hypothetical protein